MPEKSPWAAFADKLAGQKGNILALTADLGKTFVDASTMNALASSMGIRASQYNMQADWTLGSLASVRLQEEILDINVARAKASIYEKWNWRYGATKTRYAARGVSVASGSPLAMAAEILKSQNEEIEQLKTDRMIAQWNQISVPTYQAKSQAIQQRLAGDMAAIDADYQRKAASISKTAGILSAAGKAISIAGALIK